VFTSELVEFDENGNAKSKSKGKVKMIKVDEFGKTQLLVFFDTDKSILQRESFTELKHAAGFIKSNPNMKVEIAGHTDNSGTREHNLDLSKRRAIAVYENLISKGVNPDQLTLLGYASDYPISDNNTEDGRAENRRVEFVVKEFKK
ncbi:MAG: OmpA family protein, partial [Candidatus Kapaibacterium sp.]